MITNELAIACDIRGRLRTWRILWETQLSFSGAVVGLSSGGQNVHVIDAAVDSALDHLLADRWQLDIYPEWLLLRASHESAWSALYQSLPPFLAFPNSPLKSWLADCPFLATNIPQRRDTFLFFYLPLNCPLQAKCPNAFCPLAHSALERMFHPLVYRSATCELLDPEGNCLAPKKCAFAHSSPEKLAAENWWLLWERQWFGWRNHIQILQDFCDEFTASHRERSQEQDEIDSVHRSSSTVKSTDVMNAPKIVDVTRFRAGEFTHRRRISQAQSLIERALEVDSAVLTEFHFKPRPYPTRFECLLARQICNPLHFLLLGHSIAAGALQCAEIMKIQKSSDRQNFPVPHSCSLIAGHACWGTYDDYETTQISF
eukprot:Protomagalhaensia_sp_Gyna_25__887@NODE_1429_length_1845_cov_10_021595_g1153_i0_p1_GENE_NODE_1429_length_1845_cov_10_021595_g1153_i0NODE_1429_length_1845_cov_10_021595_g1153_i0_p1_ORF_typecomplete_len372_score69_92_NODE_1429_length_1845_cov_10_021595_g1153_i06011716